MDFEAEIKKLWSRVVELENQMIMLDELILSNPGFNPKHVSNPKIENGETL